MAMKGPPDAATTRWERMRLLLLAMEAEKGMTLMDIHRFLLGHFGLTKKTRQTYVEDLKLRGFLSHKRRLFHPTQAAKNHFKLHR